MADNDNKIIQTLEDLQAGQKAITKQLDEQGKDIKTIKADVAVVKHVTARTETAVETLERKVDTTNEEVDKIKKQLRSRHAD